MGEQLNNNKCWGIQVANDDEDPSLEAGAGLGPLHPNEGQYYAGGKLVALGGHSEDATVAVIDIGKPDDPLYTIVYDLAERPEEEDKARKKVVGNALARLAQGVHWPSERRLQLLRVTASSLYRAIESPEIADDILSDLDKHLALIAAQVLSKLNEKAARELNQHRFAYFAGTLCSLVVVCMATVGGALSDFPMSSLFAAGTVEQTSASFLHHLLAAPVWASFGAVLATGYRVIGLQVNSALTLWAGWLLGAVRGLIGAGFGVVAVLLCESGFLLNTIYELPVGPELVVVLAGFAQHLVPDAMTNISRDATAEDPETD